MNFKVFLKNNLISESTFLFEEDDTQQQKETFIRSAYRRVYPNGNETNVDQMWNQVRNKAYYHLTKGSKDETKKAVALAKSALNQAKARKDFNLDTDKELKDERSTDEKITSHLDDWGESDLEGLKDAVSKLENDKFKSKALIANNVNSIEDLKNAISTIADDNDKEQLLELIKAKEELKNDDDFEKIDWKDKTFDDLGSIPPEDFDKIKDKIKTTLGVNDDVKLDTIDDLKTYLGDKQLDDKQIQELDKLLDTEGVPATTGQQEQKVSQETKVPQENKVPVSTTNQEILDNIQKKQQEQELNDHLKKIGLDITSLDTGNTEVVQKIIDSGDPLLYDTYIAKNLPETSEIVQRIKKEEEERQKVQREALERRTDRFEELKRSGEVLAGVGAIFDVLASALSGKGNNFFETMSQKQSLAKGIAEGITTQLSGQYESIISNEDSNHAKELDALKTNYDQRLKDLESQKADPSKTVAYKKLMTMASQKYSESLSDLKDETQSASQRVAKVSSLNVFMSTDDFSSLDPASKSQMVDVLSEKYPRQKIQGEDGTEREEFEDEYLARIKSEADSDDIQGIIDVANDDLAMCKEKEKELNDSFSKSLEDLKQNPEVQDEIKLAEQNYKNQKAIIESEYNKAVATENTRYEKTVHCLRKTMDENKRFAKNISVLAVHSENPMDIIMHEMASRNKRLQDRAKLETGTDIFNEENCPSDPKKLQNIFNDASKGSEGKPKRGKGDDDDDDDTPKKLKKPNGGEGGPGGEGVPGTGGTGGDGGKGEPDPNETKKKAKQTASETVTALREKFKDKKEAQERLKNFLKGKNIEIDLNTVDVNNLPDDQADALNKALGEFKNQKFPKSVDELKALGIKDKDGNDFTEETFKALKPDEIKELKTKYGFDDDDGKGTGKGTGDALKINQDDFNSVKNYFNDIGPITVGDSTIDLSNIKPEDWSKQLGNQEFKNALTTALQSPKVLKALSGNIGNEEKTQVDGLEGNIQDDKTSLKEMNLKTLWKKLNDAGISIRTLPEYDPNWPDDKKKEAIAKYINAHKANEEAWKNLNESVAFSRLSSLIEANDRKIQKKSLKKFAELLVNDVRTFG